MHFSTSNSDGATARRAIRLLLVVLAGVMLSLEMGTRYLVPLVNANTRRFHAERAAALVIGAHAASTQQSLLFLGNSLTLRDLDWRVMRSELGVTNQIVRWAIDDTHYLDWYYGLRQAYRHGARPKWVIIGVRSRHFLAGHFRGRFFAHNILGLEDLASAARRTGVDATGFSNLLLAQLSSFYGSREEIFKRWLTLAIPSFPELGRKMREGGRKPVDSAGSEERLMAARFLELSDLASIYGSRIILWIPPTTQEDPLKASMIKQGTHVGIPVISLDSQGQWCEEDFTDGLHMTPKAAEVFSSMLLQALTPLLAVHLGTNLVEVPPTREMGHK